MIVRPAIRAPAGRDLGARKRRRLAPRLVGTGAARTLALAAALGAALLVVLPASAEPPTGGTFWPGQSLAGVELGMTPEQVEAAWGARHGVCAECDDLTWYVNERPFQPQGAGVVFERGCVVRAFTVWQPEGWSTPEGLELGASAGDIGATYGELAEIGCGDYDALVDNAPHATSVFYVHDDEVWGFGLVRRGRSPCV